MSEDYAVQYSVSLPPVAQYAKGDMLNIRASTVVGLEYELDCLLKSEVLEKCAAVSAQLNAVSQVTEKLGGTAITEPPSLSSRPEPSVYPPGGVQIAPPEAPQGSPVTGMICAHGKRTRREGNSTKGHWVGHFCPLQRGDANQCKPVFE